MSLGKYSTFSDNPSSLLLFLSDFLTFLILSDLFHCFYRGNAWLIFKINVSLADKSDELNMKKITIAIDGFSSCGKSTMAKDLAREVGYIYIDSGAMYRAVTLYSIENGIFDGDIIDTEKLKKEIGNIHISFRLNNDELKAKGQEASFDEILENVKQRDYIDQHRDVSPLRKADDALLLDNTNLTIAQQKEWLFDQFNKVTN